MSKKDIVAEYILFKKEELYEQYMQPYMFAGVKKRSNEQQRLYHVARDKFRNKKSKFVRNFYQHNPTRDDQEWEAQKFFDNVQKNWDEDEEEAAMERARRYNLYKRMKPFQVE